MSNSYSFQKWRILVERISHFQKQCCGLKLSMVYEPGGFTFLPGLLIMGSSYGWWSSLLSQMGKIRLEFIRYQFHNSVVISVLFWTTELKKCWLEFRMLWQGLCGLRVQLDTSGSASIYRCETVDKFLVSCVSHYHLSTQNICRGLPVLGLCRQPQMKGWQTDQRCCG